MSHRRQVEAQPQTLKTRTVSPRTRPIVCSVPQYHPLIGAEMANCYSDEQSDASKCDGGPRRQERYLGQLTATLVLLTLCPARRDCRWAFATYC
jgi:hypothetical protein